MLSAHPLLARGPVRPAPAVTPLPDTPEIALLQGRVHEASGPARRSFAMWLAARTQGPIFWIAQPWTPDGLNAEGVSHWINPARLIFVRPKRTEDLLWVMEEVLRAGATGLSVVDLPGLPTLTQVRRMHLAAESGRQNGGHVPLGLLMTPGNGGAAGVETRWHIQARHAAGHDRWQLERVRARTAPCKSWTVERPPDSPAPRIKTA